MSYAGLTDSDLERRLDVGRWYADYRSEGAWRPSLAAARRARAKVAEIKREIVKRGLEVPKAVTGRQAATERLAGWR